MPLLIHGDQPREVWREGVESRLRCGAPTGASALTVFEQWCTPGRGAPRHWHDVEELLTVLSGVAELEIDGECVLASEGCSALIPAGARHGFTNMGEGDLHMLAVLSAPVFEAHFEGDGMVSRRWTSERA